MPIDSRIIIHFCMHRCDRTSSRYNLHGVNTSGVESINSWLRRLEIAIKHLSLKRFISEVECLTDMWNAKRCREMASRMLT